MTDTLHYWENNHGHIAELRYASWAIEPWRIVRQGMDGPLFVSADKDEAIAWGDMFAKAVTNALNANANGD